MTDLLTALILVTSQPGTPAPLPTEADWPALSASVHKVAIEMEILDSRETTYVFAKRSDFQADLDLLRQRNVTLRDAPRLVDAHRLPDQHQLQMLMNFNRQYRYKLSERRLLELDREDVLCNAICECDLIYRVYDTARDAKGDYFYVTVRRTALARLRELLGEDDWAAVRFPPCVPCERFEE